MGLRFNHLHIFQLQQKQYWRDWMLSLIYEDHLYAKLFHHLISLHCHDQVICWVWWKHGLEIRIRSITTRGSGISKKHKPEECENGDGGSEGLFDLIQRQEWRNETKERAKATLKHPQKRLLNSSSLIVIIQKTKSSISIILQLHDQKNII